MNIINPKEALHNRYKPFTPKNEDFDKFLKSLNNFIVKTDDTGNEEPNKNRITNFLESIAYGNDAKYDVIPVDYIDLSIKRNGKPIVLIEVKKPSEKQDMVTTSDFNKKAFHELILYFLREIDPKQGMGNNDITNIIITNNNEWFIIDAQDFRHIADIKAIRIAYKEIDKEKTATYSKTDKFYDEVKTILNKEENKTKLDKLKVVYINFKKNYNQREQVSIYKLFTPRHLLKEFGANDSNTLNKKFYNELLHIMGLEEVGKSKKLIQRKSKNSRDSGSLLENTIRKLTTEFSIVDEQELFEKALELNITWLNRLLFLKLLDSHLHVIHGSTYNKFLDTKSIVNYDVLNTLFFEVLAIKTDKRELDILKQFGNIPYLNSSLFEPTELERDTLRISGLKDDVTMNVLSSTKTQLKKDSLHNTLHYLITFLNSYNFSSDTSTILDDEKGSLINASVLGLIFEKINGYKDGSFFTPSFITMYMTRESIRKSVVTKFNESFGIDAESIEEVKNYLIASNLHYKKEDIKHSNEIVNKITILDPAVGSGHFLVSALNELFVIKSELKLLQGLETYTVTNADDELLIFHTDNEIIFEYKVNELGHISEEKYKIQKIIFQEKQRIIENQLFGVDINPNSVKITRLRLWIELLKNSYYENNELITLPNIDINIKCGNSLISKFPLNDTDTKNKLLKDKINEYKSLVKKYMSENNKITKKEIEDKIEKLKEDFKKGLHEFSPTMVKFKKVLKDYISNNRYDGLSEELIVLAVNSTHGLQPEFFADDNTIKKAKIETKTKMLEKLEKMHLTIKGFENNEIYENSFEWRFQFPEVLNEDGNFIGFDIVIGNPPYIMEDENKSAFKGQHDKQCYQGKTDLWHLFTCKGIELAKDNGLITYIAKNQWLTSASASNMRKNIYMDTNINTIIDFGINMIFENVGQQTMIFSLQKDLTNTEHNINYLKYTSKVTTDQIVEMLNSPKESDYTTVTKKILPKIYDEKENLTFSSSDKENILNKIDNKKNFEFDSKNEIIQGIIGGPDKAFIIEKNELNTFTTVEKEYFKMLHTNTGRFFTPDTQKYICYIAKHNFKDKKIEDYPNIKHMLSSYRSYIDDKGKLKGLEHRREVLKGGIEWFHLWWARDESFFKGGAKLVWAKRTEGKKFTYTEAPLYGTANLFFINSNRVNLKYITALLNSSLMYFYMQERLKHTGDLLQIDKNQFMKIPLYVCDDVEPFEKLVDEIIELKKQGLNTSNLENKIDEKFYNLYELTKEEINIIDPEPNKPYEPDIKLSGNMI